jgi:uncharacterized protein YndB with AHSA1/START domain
MPYNFTLTARIPASPQEIYDAWLDSVAHSAMTGSEAIMSDALGDQVSAFDGYITGRNLELVPCERIVQSWRTTEFAGDHEDSLITVTLEEADGGALLTLVHTNVPERTSYKQSGWEEYYFEPMKAYFSELKGTGATKKARSKKRKAAPKKATKANRKGAAKVAPAKRPKKAHLAKKGKAKGAMRAKPRPAHR